MIGVVEDGDIISINIPENTIELKVDADVLAERMKNLCPKPKNCPVISNAMRHWYPAVRRGRF